MKSKKNISITIISISIITILSIILTTIINKNTKIDKITLENEYYNNNGLKNISKETLETLLTQKKSFIIFTYNNICTFKKPCDKIFEKVSKEINIQILQIPFQTFKETKLYEKVKYAPSIIIINEGEILTYLDANEDKDLEKYQDENKFKQWLLKYINEKR